VETGRWHHRARLSKPLQGAERNRRKRTGIEPEKSALDKGDHARSSEVEPPPTRPTAGIVVDREGACEFRVRIQGALAGADTLDETIAADAAALLRNFMVRGQNPRALAARMLADAVVRALEDGDDVAARAAAAALYELVAALLHGRTAG
jgi:ATP-dependent exoDNAse (exonuclease V) alpha subunit